MHFCIQHPNNTPYWSIICQCLTGNICLPKISFFIHGPYHSVTVQPPWILFIDNWQYWISTTLSNFLVKKNIYSVEEFLLVESHCNTAFSQFKVYFYVAISTLYSTSKIYIPYMVCICSVRLLFGVRFSAVERWNTICYNVNLLMCLQYRNFPECFCTQTFVNTGLNFFHETCFYPGCSCCVLCQGLTLDRVFIHVVVQLNELVYMFDVMDINNLSLLCMYIVFIDTYYYLSSLACFILFPHVI